MHVAVDVDDTIAATAEQFCRRVASEHGVDLGPANLPALDDLQTATLPGTEVSYAGAIAEAATDPAFLDAIDPLPGAATALTELGEQCRIEFVTRRPDAVREVTGAWLDDHGIPYDALRCGAGSDRLGDADVLVDDQPAHLDAIEEGTGVLFLRPFNIEGRNAGIADAAGLTGADPSTIATDPAAQWRAIGEHLVSLVDERAAERESIGH